MIRFILLQNRQGKTRLAKYYVPLEDSEKHKVEYEVHRLVVNRDPKFTNFVEFRTHKVIYRRYAGLFFSICVDITDNELVYLECIHLFVEILDHFFSNVCELDLVFNFHKVYLILDEFILAGELQETSKKAIIESSWTSSSTSPTTSSPSRRHAGPTPRTSTASRFWERSSRSGIKAQKSAGRCLQHRIPRRCMPRGLQSWLLP